MVIPPIIPRILYALVTEKSISDLFLAGLIPGLMLAVLALVVFVPELSLFLIR